MKIISAHGWQAFVTEYVKVGEDVVLLSFVYNKVHVEGIAAALLNKNQRTFGTTKTMIDGQYVMLTHGKHYRFQRTEVKEGNNVWTRGTLLLLDATTLNDKPESLLFLFGKEQQVPDNFVGRLALATGIPLQESWMPWLWTDALEERPYLRYRDWNKEWYEDNGVLAKRYEGFGNLDGFAVSLEKLNWLRLIRCHLGKTVKLYPGNNASQRYYEDHQRVWMLLNLCGETFWQVWRNQNSQMVEGKPNQVLGGDTPEAACVAAELQFGIQLELLKGN